MMRGLKKTLRQYAILIELLVRMVICLVLLMSCHLFASTKLMYILYCSIVCCIPLSVVQNKHMFVYNPDSGRSVVINASLVDVSPVLCE